MNGKITLMSMDFYQGKDKTGKIIPCGFGLPSDY